MTREVRDPDSMISRRTIVQGLAIAAGATAAGASGALAQGAPVAPPLLWMMMWNVPLGFALALSSSPGATVAPPVPLAVWAAHRHEVARHRRAMMSLFLGALLIAGAFTLLPGRIMHRVVFGPAPGAAAGALGGSPR